jgi:hypothetical protein
MLCCLQAWKNEIEILNCFVILSLIHHMTTPAKFLGDAWAWWDQNPSFMTLNRSVPSRSPKRILMNFTAGSLGTH